ncbi:MAG: DUF4384 domain-containing protein [Methylocella sp.]
MGAGTAILTILVWLTQETPLSAQEGTLDRSVRVIEKAAPMAQPAVPQASTPLPDNVDPDAKTNNSAGVSIDVLPRRDVQLGERMAFRVSTRNAGFLVLVDVDSEGKLTQIYPNMLAFSDLKAIDAKANFLAAENSVIVPDAAAKVNFEFVASPPLGVGMIVAILSDKPLQIVDLPDVPKALAGQSGAADFVRENARSLKVVSAEEGDQIKEPKWSIATAFYGIR